MSALTTRDLKAFQGGDVRIFAQRYAANPLYSYEYYGRISLENAGAARGEPDRKRVPSDSQRRAWTTVDTVTKDTEAQTTGFSSTAHRDLNEDWWTMFDYDEEFTLQLVIGSATHPQSFNEWSSKLILDKAHLTELRLGDGLNTQTGDDNDTIQLTGNIAYDRLIQIKRMQFGVTGGAATVREVLDSHVRWTSNGWVYYLLLKNTAATAPSLILVGQGRTTPTWTTITPTALSTDGLGNSILQVGDYLLVFAAATVKHLYSRLSTIEAGTDGFTAVTGYTASKGPRCGYARSAAQILVGGAGGYIYELSSVSASPTILDAGVAAAQDLNAAHGYGDYVVFVGAANSLVYSSDRGVTWNARTGPIAATVLNTIWCQSETEWFVGAANGKLYFTSNSGVTWSEVPVESDLTTVAQIRFYDRHNGFLAATSSSASVKGRTYRTSDGGRTWSRSAPDLSNAGTALNINTVAVADPNRVLSGGLESGTDGIAQIAS